MLFVSYARQNNLQILGTSAFHQQQTEASILHEKKKEKKKELISHYLLQSCGLTKMECECWAKSFRQHDCLSLDLSMTKSVLFIPTKLFKHCN